MPKITIEVARGESDRDYVITAIDSNGNTRIRQFAGNERDATHRAFGMSVVFGAFYDQLRYIVDEKFDTLKHIGQHPAERRADELTAQLGEIRMLLNAAEDETTAQAAARIVDLLTTAQNEIVYLRRNLDVARQQAGEQADRNQLKAWYTARMSGDQRGFDEWQAAFEHTAPLDWRIDDETPLGQMLDGMGDEVE